ncbi:SGNH/GDSL hydrolase family protein [Candidatus Micrarchaeota archaeon]|nr:SGNH/GDSL hydrolase family protein [Candidatus Micrarchaeota archaeon]
MKITIAIALTIMLFGCIAMPGGNGGGSTETGPGISPQDDGNGQPSVTDGAGGGSPSADGEDAPVTSGGTAGQTGGKTDVLMLGRSVAYGWSEYMGLEWQEDESYVGEYEGKTFRYLHMDYPPDIDDSAIRAIGAYDYDIVFFKLCFVDFGTEYGDMLADDKQYIQNIYNEAVVNRHKKLIVGNALPQVPGDTTPGLRQNHQEYNRWLADFAATHDGVYVLDLYGMLADGSGSLNSAYATSYEDSHPNRAGYGRITPAFMDRIDQAMSAGG